MKDIILYLKNKYGRWAWLGQRAHDAVGINKVLPLDFIICCDYGRETEYFFDKEFISLEQIVKQRLNWSNENLNEIFSGRYIDRFLYFLNNSQTPLNILSYRSIQKLENISKKNSNKLNIYAVPEVLKRKLDNKVFFRKNLNILKIDAIPGRTVNLKVSLFSQLKRELNIPFIVQFPYGSSGMRTYKIYNKEKYVHLCNENENVKVNVLKFIDGYCLNVNGIIIEEKDDIKVYLTYPSIQLTGLSECSSSPTIFCGNDYTSANILKNIILDKIKFITETIGKWMGLQGYRGIFGLDILVDKKAGNVYPIEINPRFQNSTGLLTELETISKDNQGHLFLFHILEFLKKKDNYLKHFSEHFNYSKLNIKLKGAQIVLHNFSNKAEVTGELLPGIYTYVNKKIVFKRKGISLSDCKNDKEILITCGVPFKNQTIAPFAPICKVQTKSSVLSFDYKTLNNIMHNVVNDVYRKLRLHSIS